MNASKITRLPALKSLKKIATVAAALAAISISTGALAPAPASAASSLSGCFNYNGTRYQNLSTDLEYRTSSGGWAYLTGTRYVTGSDGCVHYTVSGSYRSLMLRIVATGSVPAWRGVFRGYSPYYSFTGKGASNLGEGKLGFYFLPATPAASEWGVDTSAWLNEITGSTSCNSSSAMQVACYMDQHGLHGNVIVQSRDYDGDGWFDSQDNYPENKYYR